MSFVILCYGIVLAIILYWTMQLIHQDHAFHDGQVKAHQPVLQMPHQQRHLRLR
jgi:hypothetical protein